MRVGMGFDVHRFVSGRPLILGGIEIDRQRGLAGHSDADVLIHALMDALLGAAALGDIGDHFPDSDPVYQGISSVELLRIVRRLLVDRGYRVINVDIMVLAEKPKLAPFKSDMIHLLAHELQVAETDVSIK
ncbi:MAG: 2-C-methyl-D-erythritol 2,4-cyclodiphosphate synthase, partial [Bacilli bacterium]